MIVSENSFQLFAGNSHLEFALRVAGYLGHELIGPEATNRKGAKMVTKFSNENILVTIPQHMRGDCCFVIQTQAPPVNDHVWELLSLLRGLKANGAKRVVAVCPYLPYTRSDKEDQPRRVIALSLMADLMETAGVDGVLLMDPHPQAIHAYFDQKRIKVDVLRAKPLFAHYILEHMDVRKAVTVAPDVNAAKNTGGQSNTLNVPIAIIDKRRTDDSEKAKPAHMIGEVGGRDCLVFDDEVMSGGTLIETAEFCRQQGAKSVSAFVTHAVLTKTKALYECDALTRLVVTDTIPIPLEKLNAKLIVISVTECFARAIEVLAAGQESLDNYKQGLYTGLARLAHK